MASKGLLFSKSFWGSALVIIGQALDFALPIIPVPYLPLVPIVKEGLTWFGGFIGIYGTSTRTTKIEGLI
jgi:hypothetical protein